MLCLFTCLFGCLFVYFIVCACMMYTCVCVLVCLFVIFVSVCVFMSICLCGQCVPLGLSLCNIYNLCLQKH